MEDCLQNPAINDRFALVLIAAFRAREIEAGMPSKLPTPVNLTGQDAEAAVPHFFDSYEKSAVIALREVAANALDIEEIKTRLRDVAVEGHAVCDLEQLADLVVEDESLLSLGDERLDMENTVLEEKGLSTVDDLASEVDEEGYDAESLE